MIQPLEPADAIEASSAANVRYQVVAWGDNLPAFDPVLMLKTVLLSASNARRFNRGVIKFSRLLEQAVVVAVVLRFATFAVSAPVGRILAPVAAILHVPPIIVFASGMRVEYIKLIVCTFDFGFLYAANTLWAIVFSVILGDTRAVLVVVCWVNFTNSLLQETHLRNTVFMVAVTLAELLFFAMLMVWLSLEFVDEVHHYALITAHGRTFSTKDVLGNVVGTMAMLSLRNLYRRCLQHQKRKSSTVAKALGYRCKIALSAANSLTTSTFNNIVPRHQISAGDRSSKRSALQMYLSAESGRYDPQDTVYLRIGALTPLGRWKLVLLYSCGMTGGSFAVLSLFLPRNTYGGEVIAITGIIMTSGFCGVYTCCCQRQLLKRVLSSFYFLFQELQIVAAGVCLMDMFSWYWVPVCGVASGMLLSHTILTVDALTPIMKRRLQFKFWMFVAGIVIFLLVLVLLLVDVLVLGNWDLQDRVFLDLSILGHQATFHVAPFLFGRVATVFVWSSRYIYVGLTRLDDNALILLRGNVEFDYESWKKRENFDPRATRS